MSEAKPYTETEAWVDLQAKLAGHKEWLHTQAIMRVEIAPVNVGGVRDLVDALQELARVGIEAEADLASLRADYEACVRNVAWIQTRLKEGHAGAWAARQIEESILSTPRARAILGTSDATHTAEGR